MSNFTLDVGLAAKLKVAFARNGWTEELVDSACEGDKLGQFREVLLGRSSITVIENLIDCGAAPFVPNGWSVEEHQKGGQFKLAISQVQLFLAKGQQDGKSIEGNKLRKELAGKKVLNANVLDYLLANPHLIPEEWKGKYVFFWGTIYRRSDGNLFVRCLYWLGDWWVWSYRWLGRDFGGLSPAALRAS